MHRALTVSRVYGLASRVVRNAQTTEEAFEDVYWQLWCEPPRFDPSRGTVMAWLLTLARSRALDALRRLEGRRRHEQPVDDDAAEARPDESASPPELLATTQTDACLHTALAELEPLPRQLLSLAFFRGMTHEEVAAHMSMPLGTDKYLRRTLAQLRSQFQTAPTFARTHEPHGRANAPHPAGFSTGKRSLRRSPDASRTP